MVFLYMYINLFTGKTLIHIKINKYFLKENKMDMVGQDRINQNRINEILEYISECSMDTAGVLLHKAFICRHKCVYTRITMQK